MLGHPSLARGSDSPKSFLGITLQKVGKGSRRHRSESQSDSSSSDSRSDSESSDCEPSDSGSSEPSVRKTVGTVKRNTGAVAALVRNPVVH